MKICQTAARQKFLFLFGITAIYSVLVAWLEFLKGPMWWDEKTFWATSLTFSDRLLPTLDQLRNYQELNTPLPFIIFGLLEYFFRQGIVAGRLLNLVLSLIMVMTIGWPGKDNHGQSILCLIGLLMCPYYLWLSGRLYTEMIACFWVIMGLINYLKNRSFLSCIAFILAIASRQYMLAFPLAIAAYEFTLAVNKIRHYRQVDWSAQCRWLFPLIAALSLGVWLLLFQGLVPEAAIEAGGKAPEVQKTIWALMPGGAINFLAFVGFYMVIPEFILFRPQEQLSKIKQRWLLIVCIAVGLFIFCQVFPPYLEGNGILMNASEYLPTDALKIILFWGLSLLACIRFWRPNLMFVIILLNSLIMMKAYPWDRYVLPLAVVFWYLKSVWGEDQRL